MLRKELILAAIAAIFSFYCQAEAAQIAVTWDGGGDGYLWADPYNWDPDVVPDNNATNTYAVTINAGGHIWLGLQQPRTIDQLDCYGEFELHKWPMDQVVLTLVDPSGLTNHGYLVIVRLWIDGNVTNTAGATLELEDTEIEGDLYNQAGATIEVFEVSDEVCIDGTVENAGSMTITPVSKLNVEGGTLHNTGQINIYGGSCSVYDGIIDNNDTGLIKGFGVLYTDQLLRNKGQIYAYGGSFAVLSEGPFLNTGVLCNKPSASLYVKPEEDVNNNGTIEINAGDGITFDCNLVNDTNGVIELLNGTLAATTITQRADANFSGFGGITGDIVIDPNRIIELTGTTNIVGDVNISPNATLQISDGATLITGQTVCNGTIHIKGGYLIPQGGLSGSCNIIWEAGLFTNPADFNLDGEVNFGDFAYFAETWLWQTSWN
jgi:hypothetical protein